MAKLWSGCRKRMRPSTSAGCAPKDMRTSPTDTDAVFLSVTTRPSFSLWCTITPLPASQSSVLCHHVSLPHCTMKGVEKAALLARTMCGRATNMCMLSGQNHTHKCTAVDPIRQRDRGQVHVQHDQGTPHALALALLQVNRHLNQALKPILRAQTNVTSPRHGRLLTMAHSR